MRKFSVLLKKEIKELFTVQMLIPIIIGICVFLLLGTVMSDLTKQDTGEGSAGKIVVLDLDHSAFSDEAVNILNSRGFDVTIKKQGQVTDVIEEARQSNRDAVLVIPELFEEKILNGNPQTMDAYSMLKSLSITGQSGDGILEMAVDAVNQHISNLLIAEHAQGISPEVIKTPVSRNDFVVVNGKTANVSSTTIKSFMLSQNIVIPLVMFMIIIYSAQLLITTIASEKENKTMETLLSTPVSRSSIIGAKMVAAGLSALVYALIYMLGFQYYMGSMTGGQMSGDVGAQMSLAMEQLGLTMGLGDYLILGLSLFASILVALALASILGTMAEDVKKAQGFITPVMLLVMVPYMLTMFVDMNTAQPLIKLLVNIIPFAHPFMASSQLFLNQYVPALLGLLYQLAVFGGLLFIATKIYSSDKIFMTKHAKPKSRRRILLKK